VIVVEVVEFNSLGGALKRAMHNLSIRNRQNDHNDTQANTTDSSTNNNANDWYFKSTAVSEGLEHGGVQETSR